ncbi:MAG: beta-ketoacyl-ACP synthase III [Chitinophagales bacterium]|nr:beta-ketoacyl-ACP synthase III [Chitinophagales bacterium]
MSFNEVYIIQTARFLPNHPVSNDEIEEYLGCINGKPSRSRRIVLRNNGIKQRYYALEKGGKTTHTNAEMAALAVRELFANSNAALGQIQVLACGTSSPDQIMPSHGIMVHGCLPETGAVEVVSPSGNCCSGMHALKFAYLTVKTGEANVAVATGSERTSGVLRATGFEEEAKHLAALETNPYIAFEKDFLRWMLSDGAGAFLLSNQKSTAGISLKIEWIESASYAHKIETCMYQGCDKLPDGTLKSYMDFSPEEIAAHSVLSMKQDVKLLDKYIVELGYDKLRAICDKKNLSVNDIDYFLPHLSSEFFRSKIAAKLEENGMGIPQEKWFSNLTEVGNVGAGSVYIMIDELVKSGKLEVGQKILLMVPESSRFSYVYALLTVC